LKEKPQIRQWLIISTTGSTKMNKYAGFKSVREGAKELIKAAVGPKEEVHGHTVGDYGIMAW
jgi:hypothetical protein